MLQYYYQAIKCYLKKINLFFFQKLTLIFFTIMLKNNYNSNILYQGGRLYDTPTRGGAFDNFTGPHKNIKFRTYYIR